MEDFAEDNMDAVNQSRISRHIREESDGGVTVITMIIIIILGYVLLLWAWGGVGCFTLCASIPFLFFPLFAFPSLALKRAVPALAGIGIRIINKQINK